MENLLEEPDPRPLLLKRLLWDIFPHDPELVSAAQVRMGLVPDSPEGLDVEHGASDARINRAMPLADTLHTLSGFAAEVIREYIIACTDDDTEASREFMDSLAEQNAEIVFDSAFAIIANLLDSGVLACGREVLQ